MAETLISPGVLQRENDISFITTAPVEAGAAFIGPAVKGPVEQPTLVRSYGEYQRVFGTTFKSGSVQQEYLTSLAVKNYFNQGGSTALVTRVVHNASGFTPAVNTEMTAFEPAITAAPFTLTTLGSGVILNNSLTSAAPAANGDGSLVLGTGDNLRWEISNINPKNGTFSLLIRRGDDNNQNKIVLETFTKLSLDPNSEDYIEKRIGNQYTAKTTDGGSTYLQQIGEYPNRSSYVRISSVNLPTLNYLANDGIGVNEDSAGVSYSGSLPVATVGGFHSAAGSLTNGGDTYFKNIATTTQGLVASDYTDAIAILENADEYQFNIISAPGLIQDLHSTPVDAIVSLAEGRGDCIAVIDLEAHGAAIASVVDTAAGVNSSYAATYWPWVQLASGTGRNEWCPASTVMPGVYAFTDGSAAPWYAPAGLVRGGIPTVLQAERKLTSSQRDILYSANINPIATFPGQGISAFGQKTLQKKASALDRVNVRRLLIELKKFVGSQAKNLVFEQNTVSTRNKFLSAVNPYLESVVQRQGLYAYRVVMDDSNNSPDVVDRNQLIGQIFIQPAKTVEFIVLDFVIEPTGATFNV